MKIDRLGESVPAKGGGNGAYAPPGNFLIVNKQIVASILK